MERTLPVVALGFLTALAGFARAAERDYQRSADVDAEGNFRISASFVNVNRDALTLLFPLPRRAVEDASQEFGYSRADTQEMARSCGCTQEEYDRKVEQYYQSRAVNWRLVDGVRRLYVDIPQVVERNRPRLRALAAEFDKLSTARGYGSDQALGALLTFVQSALLYKGPPDEEGDRDMLGFFPPPRALLEGYGDCDTKSALLAAILTNFPGTRMIGVHVPQHYLVGIARLPRPGDAFIEYGGEPFVLVEPSGPARLPPGQVGPTTQAALATMNGVRIDPLF